MIFVYCVSVKNMNNIMALFFLTEMLTLCYTKSRMRLSVLVRMCVLNIVFHYFVVRFQKISCNILVVSALSSSSPQSVSKTVSNDIPKGHSGTALKNLQRIVIILSKHQTYFWRIQQYANPVASCTGNNQKL